MIVRLLVVGSIMENTYIVGSEDTKECAIIDPGGEADRVLEEVEQLVLTAKVVLNTHGHGDHTRAVVEIEEATGATYAIHEGDIDLLKQDNQCMAVMVPGVKEPPEPDWYVKNDDVIEIGEVKLRVIETPGHTL